MTKRNVEKLERSGPPGDAASGELVQSQEPTFAASLPLVDVHYPDPTPLTVVVRDVARWSGLCFVMTSQINLNVQIFAPHRQSPHHAYELFLAALAVAGLRTVQVGSVVKIVPPSLPTAV